jgi:hypothetical protein
VDQLDEEADESHYAEANQRGNGDLVHLYTYQPPHHKPHTQKQIATVNVLLDTSYT